MKKILLVGFLLAMMPFALHAQNKVIEQLAEKYSNRDGFNVISLKGEMTKYIVDMSNVSLSTYVDNIASIMDDISSIVVISSEKSNEQFRIDVNTAVASEEYSTLMSVSDGGQTIKFMLAPAPENTKHHNEFVMVIFDETEDILISIVGNYKVKQLSKTK
jgi:hypothetical protein